MNSVGHATGARAATYNMFGNYELEAALDASSGLGFSAHGYVSFCRQLVNAALDLGRIYAPIERMSRIAAKKPPAIPEISSGSWPLAPHSRPAHRPADKTAKPVAP